MADRIAWLSVTMVLTSMVAVVVPLPWVVVQAETSPAPPRTDS